MQGHDAHRRLPCSHHLETFTLVLLTQSLHLQNVFTALLGLLLLTQPLLLKLLAGHDSHRHLPRSDHRE
jgi:hypothetical protein